MGNPQADKPLVERVGMYVSAREQLEATWDVEKGKKKGQKRESNGESQISHFEFTNHTHSRPSCL